MMCVPSAWHGSPVCRFTSSRVILAVWHGVVFQIGAGYLTCRSAIFGQCDVLDFARKFFSHSSKKKKRLSTGLVTGAYPACLVI